MSQPPPPPGPYQPYQYGGVPSPYGQPPKSSNRTLWIVLGVVGGLILLCCAGGVVLVAFGVVAADRAIDEEIANDRPTAIDTGGSFEHDDFRAASGWRVVDDGLGDFDIVELVVTNESEDTRTAYLEFTIHRDGAQLGQVSCSSSVLGPDESAVLACYSADPFAADFDQVKVADSF